MSRVKVMWHMALDIESALKVPERAKGSLKTEEGKVLNTIEEVTEYLQGQLALGRKVLPLQGCDNCDYQRGCRGHKINESGKKEK